MFEDHCNRWLRNDAKGAGLRCKSGLGVSITPTGRKNLGGRHITVNVEIDTDPKDVEGWTKDWLPYGDKSQHLRPQVYTNVPVALVNNLIRANGGTN